MIIFLSILFAAALTFCVIFFIFFMREYDSYGKNTESCRLYLKGFIIFGVISVAFGLLAGLLTRF